MFLCRLLWGWLASSSTLSGETNDNMHIPKRSHNLSKTSRSSREDTCNNAVTARGDIASRRIRAKSLHKARDVFSRQFSGDGVSLQPYTSVHTTC